MKPCPLTVLVLAALSLAAGPAVAQTPAATQEPVGHKLVEIYRVAPGKQEAFLRAVARLDEANRRGGVAPRQLFVHEDGASWDFMLIQDAEYPEGKGEAVGKAYDAMGLPGGPRFFVEFRTLILEHTDTFVKGPTTAAAYLAALDATPRATFPEGAARAYALARVVPLGGPARWDYLTVDAGGRRVFLAHGDAVDVVDLDTRAVTGHVTGLAGAHGIALVPGAGRGFVANGDRGTVTAFSLSTLQPVGEAPVGEDPDSVTFEPVTGRLFVWNAGSADVTVLDAASLEILGTVKLGGGPEFAVADGRGSVFVNLEDTGEIVRVDAAGLRITARYPLPGCEGPHGLAIDPAGRRLYSAGANAVLAVVDADTGRLVGRSGIGRGADAVVFDADRQRVLVSNGEGFVSVFDVVPGGALREAATVQTRATGRTMALDPASGALLVPAVDLDVDWGRHEAAFVPSGLKLYVFEPAAT